MKMEAITKSKKPTINDVARVSGLSKKTVSRVLNNSPQVAESTRKRVSAVIEQLGFSPDPQARSLASKKSFVLGLVYDNPNALYISDIQKGVLRACQGTGYELIMHPGDFSNQHLIDEIEGFVSRARIGGLILLSPISQRDALSMRLRRDEIPYVRICPKKIDTDERIVVSNDLRGSEMMVEYLVSIGHRAIGFVTGPESNLSAQEKYDGYCNVMKKAGLPLREDFVAHGDNTFDSGELAGNLLLRRNDRPSVVFASNDAMALGVLKSASMLGLRVPQDVAIAGFDDSALATVTWPDLTTIRQPVEWMGEIAARKLLSQLTNGSISPDLPLATEPELVVRHSTMNHA